MTGFFQGKCSAGSRRAAGLQPSLKNLRQKIPPNGPTRLKFRFSYEISQHNHLRYFRHHFGSTFPRNPKNNVSLVFNDAAYAMTFSTYLPMNLAIPGLSSAQP